MFFDHNNRDRFPFDKPRKLKHLVLSSIFYRLLNTSYIFTYNSFLYCPCDQFQGCHTKPVNSIIADRNYCYICHVKVTYNEKQRKMKKMAFVYNNFLEIKQDIQLCIDFDPNCKNVWMYHYKETYGSSFANFKWRYLKSLIDYYIYKICYNDQ